MRSLFALFLLCIAISTARSTTLKDVIVDINTKNLEDLKREINALPYSEKCKIEVLYLLQKGKEEEAKRILSELRENKKVLSNIILLPSNIYSIVVDKANERLFLVRLEGGIPKVVLSFPCITGKRPGDKLKEGDQRTPEGIYFPMYWKANLPKVYGIGAFPLDYPNLLDREILKRDGYGIWIHGTDNPNRPPYSSNGCIVLRNSDLGILRKYISLKRTPVVIVSKLSYSTEGELLSERESLLNFIMTWKRAWENTPKDIDGYLSLYDKDFVWDKGNLDDWVRYKKGITKYKKWIKIKISDLTIAKDGRLLKFGNIYVARMVLNYKSNNYKSVSNKVLYIIKRDGKWKILGEENL